MKKLSYFISFLHLIAVFPSIAQHNAGSKHMIEHMAVLALVKDADVTHTAVQDGNWSDSAVWGGASPTNGARVLVSSNIAVTVDTVLPDTYRTIRVDGTLRFATAVDTQLKVDTLVVGVAGTLEMGTSPDPVQDHVTARLVFDNIGDFELADINSPDYDPHKLGLGLIAQGNWMAYGMEKTGSATYTGARAGDITMQLDHLPDNWEVGDEIVIANCRRDAEGDEVRTIAAVDTVNDILTLDSPLSEDHITPWHHREGVVLRMHIINLTRNVIVETAAGNEDVLFGVEYSYRGHTMMMHSNLADLRYVHFREMGRTNKQVPSDLMKFAEFDMSGNLISPADNPIARYPVHFHRAGSSTSLAVVLGCSVSGSPGWGYVNHSSAVKMNENVAYNINGAAFISEAGNEIGEFYDNVAVRTHGTGGENGGGRFKEFGNAGDGLWIHSQYVRAERNVASGFTGHGFVHWNTPTDGVNFSSRLPSQFSADPELEDGPESETLAQSATYMKDNTMYGGRTGLFATFSQRNGRKNNMSHLLVFGVKNGIRQKYFQDMIIYDSVFIGDLDDPQGSAFNTHNKGTGWKFLDCHFEGFESGISNPGKWLYPQAVVGGYYNNINNILFRKFHVNDNRILVKDAILAHDLRPRALHGLQQSDFKGVAAMAHGGRLESHTNAIQSDLYFMENGQIYEGYLDYHQRPSSTPFAFGTDRLIMSEADKLKTNAALEPYNYAIEYVPTNAIEIAGYTYDNWIHEPVSSLPSGFDELGVCTVNPLPNLILLNAEMQSVIELADVFYEPLDETLIYTVSHNSNPGLVSASISGTTLTLNYSGSVTGESVIRITATAPVRGEVETDGFKVERVSSLPALPPVGTADGYSVNQDTTLNVAASGVLANDNDPNGDAMTVQVKERTNHGTLNLSSDGSFTYSPDAAFSGGDWFVYRPYDGTAFGDPVRVTITVNDTGNDAPIAVDDAPEYYEAIETLVFEIDEPTDGVLWNDYDYEGDAITVASYDNVSSNGGTVMVNADGTFSYTPLGDFTGWDSFTYTAADGTAASQPATVHLFVKKVFSAARPFFIENWVTRTFTDTNTPPNPNNWIKGNDFGYGFDISGAAEEGDVDNMALGTSRGNKGEMSESLSVNIDASNFRDISVEYARRLYRVFGNSDHYLKSYWSGDGGSTWNVLEQVSETVTTLSGGEPLVDGQLYEITAAGTNVDYSAIGGPDADNAVIGAFFLPPDGSSVPAGGDLNESPIPDDEDGTIDWTVASFDLPAEADATANLMLRFYFKSAKNPPKLSLDNIKVLGIPVSNSVPGVTDDIYSVDEDFILDIDNPYLGVLGNDHDAEGDYREVELLSQPLNGQLTLRKDGTFTYTPDTHFHGTDSFSYRSTDLRLVSPTGTVTITVNSIEDVPVASDDVASVVQNSSASVDVLDNDADDDGDDLDIVAVGSASNGSVQIDANNLRVIYTPDIGFQGNDAFTYTISDGKANAVGTVNMTVEGAADAPVALPVNVSVPEEGSVDITLVATDLNGDPLTYSIIDQPANGSVSLSGNTATYTPDGNFSGSDSFTFRANDGVNDSNVATVDVTVTAANDTPVAFSVSGSTSKDTPVFITLSASDTDGDALTYSVVSPPSNGSVIINGNTATYTPASGYTGSDSFTFKVNDGMEDSNTATVDVFTAKLLNGRVITEPFDGAFESPFDGMSDAGIAWVGDIGSFSLDGDGELLADTQYITETIVTDAAEFGIVTGMWEVAFSSQNRGGAVGDIGTIILGSDSADSAAIESGSMNGLRFGLIDGSELVLQQASGSGWSNIVTHAATNASLDITLMIGLSSDGAVSYAGSGSFSASGTYHFGSETVLGRYTGLQYGYHKIHVDDTVKDFSAALGVEPPPPPAPSTYETWQDLYYTPTEIFNGLADRLVDSDGDGLFNEYEFYFGLDPRIITTNPVVRVGLESGNRYPSITYTRRQETNIVYTVHACWNLQQSWSNVTPYMVTEGALTDHGDGRETLTQYYPVEIASNVFLRVDAEEE